MNTMTEAGTVVSLHIAAREGAPLQTVDEAELVTGQGIRGDRHCKAEDPPGEAQVSLVDAELIDTYARSVGYPVQPYDTRRNIVTRGIDLNGLVGARFRIGDVVLIGVEPAEPCKYLAEMLIEQFGMSAVEPKDVVADLLHSGGLYAKILGGGSVRPGDTVSVSVPD